MAGTLKSRKSPKKAKEYVYSDTEESAVEDNNIQPVIAVKKEPLTLSKFFTRFFTASLMAALYLSILCAGHFYCIVSLFLSQIEIYREIVNIRYVEAKERSMPYFRTLQWLWFFTAMTSVYGETLHRFLVENHEFVHVTKFTRYYSHVVFFMYWILFICTVLTLKTGLIRFQLSQYMWSIVSICLVVFQCKFFAFNTLNGIFWFFFPMATVIMNDVSAYLVGITFGKKLIKAPFLALSPNKTWEGFIGAAILTVIFSFLFPGLLAQYSWLICPIKDINLTPFYWDLQCEPNPVFLLSKYTIPFIGKEMMLYPIQVHGLAYGLFASLVAPFGGFFASALKRAYHKKDFESFMPGHGGMMDRMDCQLLMASFTSFYYFAFIQPRAYTVPKMMFLISYMAPSKQMELYQMLGKQLGQMNSNV